MVIKRLSFGLLMFIVAYINIYSIARASDKPITTYSSEDSIISKVISYVQPQWRLLNGEYYICAGEYRSYPSGERCRVKIQDSNRYMDLDELSLLDALQHKEDRKVTLQSVVVDKKQLIVTYRIHTLLVMSKIIEHPAIDYPLATSTNRNHSNGIKTLTFIKQKWRLFGDEYYICPGEFRTSIKEERCIIQEKNGTFYKDIDKVPLIETLQNKENREILLHSIIRINDQLRVAYRVTDNPPSNIRNNDHVEPIQSKTFIKPFWRFSNGEYYICSGEYVLYSNGEICRSSKQGIASLIGEKQNAPELPLLRVLDDDETNEVILLSIKELDDELIVKYKKDYFSNEQKSNLMISKTVTFVKSQWRFSNGEYYICAGEYRSYSSGERCRVQEANNDHYRDIDEISLLEALQYKEEKPVVLKSMVADRDNLTVKYEIKVNPVNNSNGLSITNLNKKDTLMDFVRFMFKTPYTIVLVLILFAGIFLLRRQRFVITMLMVFLGIEMFFFRDYFFSILELKIIGVNSSTDTGFFSSMVVFFFFTLFLATFLIWISQLFSNLFSRENIESNEIGEDRYQSVIEDVSSARTPLSEKKTEVTTPLEEPKVQKKKRKIFIR